jgi:hypothetical protein
VGAGPPRQLGTELGVGLLPAVGCLRELAQCPTSDTVVHDVEVSALLGRGAEQIVLL